MLLLNKAELGAIRKMIGDDKYVSPANGLRLLDGYEAMLPIVVGLSSWGCPLGIIVIGHDSSTCPSIICQAKRLLGVDEIGPYARLQYL